MSEEVLKVKSLSKRYVTGNEIETNALCGIDLCVHKNEMLAVMGRSGSGKSTMINLLTGVVTADEGQVLFNWMLSGDFPNGILSFRSNSKQQGREIYYVNRMVCFGENLCYTTINRDVERYMEVIRSTAHLILEFSQGGTLYEK